MFKVSLPTAGGSWKSHNIKCAKLLTSTVESAGGAGAGNCRKITNSPQGEPI